MKAGDFISFLLYILFICSVNHVEALDTEEIINGVLADTALYHAAICGVPVGKNVMQLIGSGALIGDKYALSAAHLFVDIAFAGRYVLKPMTFYLRLGSIHLGDANGETVYVDHFFLMDYDKRTGKNDLILIKLGPIVTLRNKSWWKVQPAFERWYDLTREEGLVSSYGMHNTEHDIDSHLRYATAKIVNNSNCDKIVEGDISYRCIKMSKDRFGLPKGLCKYDGGAPFVVSNNSYLVGIARKPKDNCDDTVRGNIYTDVRPFDIKIKLLTEDEPQIYLRMGITSQILQNYPSTPYKGGIRY